MLDKHTRMGGYTAVIAELDVEALRPWGGHIAQLGRVEDVNEPSLGMVMMRAQESVQRHVFNAGEIFVSEATLTVDGVVGYGIVMGNALEKARIVALLDAVHHNMELKWNDFREQFRIWIAKQEKEQRERRQADFALTQRTKVDFQLMDTEEEDEA
ncbi:phosphonate C-P lyase system protein PhnG [Paenibacillus guangzhouensis]|uniref:phosphonate C-P lyase system protein PhnG n=1 Tax=Paenibacillus guangzhouensis TaxID=1473112 RepID=UPI00187B99EA|nr:phosphonate C-P lyase system protein PhnG [Paenibacillus guangzhouensis]